MKKQTRKNGLFALVILIAIIVIALLTFHFAGSHHDNSKQNVYAIFPLTGSFAAGGKILTSTVDLFLQTYPDSDIEITYVDSQSDPSKAISAVRQGIVGDTHPVSILGITSVSSAVLPLLEEQDGFSFPVCALKTASIEGLNKCQFLSYDIKDVSGLPAEYAASKHSTAAIVFSNEDYGRDGAAAFRESFEQHGGTVLGEFPFALGNVEVRDVVNLAMQTKPDCLFIVGVTTAGYINLFKGVKEYGYSGEVISDIVFSSPFIYKTLGSIAENVVCVCCDSDFSIPQTEAGRNFRKLCLENGIDPYYGVVEVYDALLVIREILKSGKAFSQKTLLDIGTINGATCLLKFHKPGETQYQFYLGRVHNGEIVPLTQRDP